jgi:hypothetical protein
MSRQGRIGEWCRFFGVRTPDEGAAELHKLVARLDDAYDQLNYLARLLAGCPSDDAEEGVRIARTSVDEATDLLGVALRQMRADDPDAA